MLPTLSQTHVPIPPRAAVRPTALQMLLLRVAGKLEERTHNPWFALQRSAVDKGNIHDATALGRTLEQFHVLISPEELELLFQSFSSMMPASTANAAATSVSGDSFGDFASTPSNMRLTFDMKSFAATLFNRPQPSPSPSSQVDSSQQQFGVTRLGGADILAVEEAHKFQSQQQSSIFSHIPLSHTLGEEKSRRAHGGVRRVTTQSSSATVAAGATTTRPSALLRKAATSSLQSSSIPVTGSMTSRRGVGGASSTRNSHRLHPVPASGSVTARNRPPPAAVPRFDFCNLNKLEPRYEPQQQATANKQYIHSAR